jgi:hypothetical protein
MPVHSSSHSPNPADLQALVDLSGAGEQVLADLDA